MVGSVARTACGIEVNCPYEGQGQTKTFVTFACLACPPRRAKTFEVASVRKNRMQESPELSRGFLFI